MSSLCFYIWPSLIFVFWSGCLGKPYRLFQANSFATLDAMANGNRRHIPMISSSTEADQRGEDYPNSQNKKLKSTTRE